MKNKSIINQILDFRFFGIKKLRDHSRDSKINNLDFLAPKIPMIFRLQKIGEAVRNYFFFLFIYFFTVLNTVNNSFHNRRDRGI